LLDTRIDQEERMGERGGPNIEIAHKLNESEEYEADHRSPSLGVLEIVEAIVLATVAIATAWSGYQSARWDGLQDELYAKSSRLRVEAAALQTRSGQEQTYDASAAAEWIKAEAAGNQKVAQMFARRMRPEFRPAFEAWVKLDPINNTNAPPGPMAMPEYRNAHAEEAAKRGEEATEAFEHGAAARAISDKYVRATVTLATVLLLVAISQRFRTQRVRTGLAIVAILLVCLPVLRVILLPRIW
jgi:hypothetical protein